ncbi:MAG: sigma-54 dependent transcriptional regulator [Prevotellaceae bacterium]|jgi:two-component system response regulator HydG|nr:sigma-54 dependent transcriptional regulator [Prevotellaceae bacterium]
MHSIIIVEDDLTLSLMLKAWLSKKNFLVVTAPNIKEAKKKIKKRIPHIILSDLRLPDGDGISLLRWVRTFDAVVPMIIMTSYVEIGTAVESIKSGAYDYISKPLNQEELLLKLEIALKETADIACNHCVATVEAANDEAEQNELADDDSDGDDAENDFVCGQSPMYKQLYEYVDLVAPTNMSVFVLGESGVGKEHIAKWIHDKSKRKDAPFIAVDCGVLSKELAASEFFGHVKGSFTGAINNKQGFFLAANGGTIFLDEVGNLSPEVQIQLLRVLQERKIRPVGSEKDVPIDVRVIVATNEKINVNAPNPSFRLDLYHRLSEFVMYVPALRECKEDIPTYLNYFLAKANKELDKSILGFDEDALQMLTEYEWKGNLREMKNIINRMVLITQGQRITKKLVMKNIILR